jgi:hypothetical protein
MKQKKKSTPKKIKRRKNKTKQAYLFSQKYNNFFFPSFIPARIHLHNSYKHIVTNLLPS